MPGADAVWSELPTAVFMKRSFCMHSHDNDTRLHSPDMSLENCSLKPSISLSEEEAVSLLNQLQLNAAIRQQC